MLRSEVLGQRDQLLTLIERGKPGVVQRLREDALAELTLWDEVQVRHVDREPDTTETGCSVAGSYLPDTHPPTLAVARAASWRREHFTALHELGHHEQQSSARLASTVRRHADPVTFEDAVCDAFAAAVLIGQDDVATALAGRPPSAATIAALFQTSNASRAACCVRLLDELGTTGCLAVLNELGVVSFAVARGDLYPPARGSDQSSTPLVAAALARGGDAQHDLTFVRYLTGGTSDHLYGDAVWCDGMLLVVAVADHAGWKKFSVARPSTRTFASPFEVPWCETCSTEFTPAAGRCERCHEFRCSLGHCACTQSRNRQCDRCFLELAPSRFPDKKANTCNDCSG